MAEFPALAHVALTVRDLSVGVPRYQALLGEGTLLGRHQHVTAAPDGNFSECRVGLDHVALGCGDRAELERWTARLDALGGAHRGIKDASYGSGVSFRNPDGIALEFFAPPS